MVVCAYAPARHALTAPTTTLPEHAMQQLLCRTLFPTDERASAHPCRLSQAPPVQHPPQHLHGPLCSHGQGHHFGHPHTARGPTQGMGPISGVHQPLHFSANLHPAIGDGLGPAIYGTCIVAQCGCRRSGVDTQGYTPGSVAHDSRRPHLPISRTTLLLVVTLPVPVQHH